MAGSISGATSMRPAISAPKRCELPPICETVTSCAVQPELLERDADGDVGFRAERADAEGLALEVRRGLDRRRGEHRDRDGVAGRGDQPQVGALLVGQHDRREPDMHGLDFAGQQHLDAAAAAFHVDDFDLEPFLGVEAAGLRHPDREDGHDRRRDADLERGEVGGVRGLRAIRAARNARPRLRACVTCKLHGVLLVCAPAIHGIDAVPIARTDRVKPSGRPFAAVLHVLLDQAPDAILDGMEARLALHAERRGRSISTVMVSFTLPGRPENTTTRSDR